MLRVENISHAYDDVISLRQASLQVHPREIVCLLGPSGCGKTTLLRVIAGLESACAGSITYEGIDIGGIPAHKREFGLMFQDYALFPHMNVGENIAYGLKRRGVQRRLIAREVDFMLERVGMAGMGERDIAALSGGQKQRVALARSLAPKPRLLMLDEPLGSLDAQLRDQLALDLRQLINEEGLSAIYVTHDHKEAYAVADRIAVMSVGSVQQADTPRDLYRRPSNAFVARFLGMSNIFDTEHSPFAKQICAAALKDDAPPKTILIHPGGLSFGPDAASQSLPYQAVLTGGVFRGHHVDVSVVLTDGTRLTFSAPALPAVVGANIEVRIALNAVMSLDS